MGGLRKGSMYFRTTLLAFAMLLTPFAAHADYLDVITNRLKDGCSIEKYSVWSRNFAAS